MRNREVGVPPEGQADMARAMRKEPTKAEGLLWGRLRNKQIGGLRFRRQEPVGSYIVDFLCASHRLIIEVDGWSHEETEAYDARRHQALERLGYRVLRFSNEDVLKSLEGVVSAISRACSLPDDALP